MVRAAGKGGGGGKSGLLGLWCGMSVMQASSESIGMHDRGCSGDEGLVKGTGA